MYIPERFKKKGLSNKWSGLMNRKKTNIGEIPGEPVFMGEQMVEKPSIEIIKYSRTGVVEKSIDSIKEVDNFIDEEGIIWINVIGLHDTELIKRVSEMFSFHILLTEDIVNTEQRPKMEEYDDALFFIIKMLRYDDSNDLGVINEQLSIVLKSNLIITFQEKPGDVFEPVRERIRKGRGRIRSSGPDYLAYVLLDTVIDNYIYIMERTGEHIEDIEDELVSEAKNNTVARIYHFKQRINFFRKMMRPAGEFVTQLSKLETHLIQESTYPFLKDLQDNSKQALERIETDREMLSDQLNIYNTLMNNHLSEIMKVLTIFSAVFIPLTFLAGIYGTNFDYLPELHYKYSYLIFWIVIVFMVVGMLLFFKKKRWI